MKSHIHAKSSIKRFVNNKQILEYTYQKMSIEEIKKANPKSRLESFLRRKALEEKNSV